MKTINCPSCRRSFILKHRPGKTFVCPKCGFTAPFETVLNAGAAAEGADVPSHPTLPNIPPTDPGLDRHTVVVDGLDQHTVVIDGLQKKKKKTYGFQVRFQGAPMSPIKLPVEGKFTLGRRSSDSTASIKVAPDMAMSRIQAGMRVMGVEGRGVVYQITSAKASNPVQVNGVAVAPGQAVTLRPGDRVRMGDTELEFGEV